LVTGKFLQFACDAFERQNQVFLPETEERLRNAQKHLNAFIEGCKSQGPSFLTEETFKWLIYARGNVELALLGKNEPTPPIEELIARLETEQPPKPTYKAVVHDINDCSEESRRLAKQHTRKELERMLKREEANLGIASAWHRNAVSKTSSMQSQSNTRAMSNNTVALHSNRVLAIEIAIAIHETFPEHAKQEKEAT
jgi:hypothetical protein